MSNKPQPIELLADGYQVYGPKVDGSFTVKVGVGEHQREQLSKLMRLKLNQKLAVYIMPLGETDGGR